jgi:hypothetical protein
LVEQLIRNQQVVGSSPIPGSSFAYLRLSWRLAGTDIFQLFFREQVCSDFLPDLLSHFSFLSSAIKRNSPWEDYLYFVVEELRHFYIFLVILTDPFGKTNGEIYQIAF